MQLETLIKKLDQLELKPVKLSKWEEITDPQRFVKSHTGILKANSGNRLFIPYYTRLLKYYEICSKS